MSCCQAARPGSLVSGLQDTSFQYITKCVVDIRKVRAPRQKHHHCLRQSLFLHEPGVCAACIVQVLEGNHGLQERCLRCGHSPSLLRNTQIIWASRLKALSRLVTTVIEIQGTAEGVVAGSVCAGFKADARLMSTSCRKRSLDSGEFAPSCTRCGAQRLYSGAHKKDVKVKGPFKGPH